MGATRPEGTPQTTSDLSGLEYLQGVASGNIARAPMAELLPFDLCPPEIGVVRAIATPEKQHYNTLGIVHGGWALTMLDTAMGMAARTTLKPREVAPSHETSVKFLRAMTTEAGPFTITGTVVTRGRTVISLVGQIEDSSGKIYAHGTSTCLVVSPDRVPSESDKRA